MKIIVDVPRLEEVRDDDTSWIVNAIECQTPTIIEADKEELENADSN